MQLSLKTRRFLKSLVSPVSTNEDRARHEFIFNVISFSIIVFSIIVLVVDIFRVILGMNNAVPIIAVLVLCIFFSGLYFLSRKGLSEFAASLLLTIFFFLSTYQSYVWGINLPFGLLSYVLIIVMAGILISTRFAFIVTFIIGTTIVIIGYFQKVNIVSADRYWVNEIWGRSEIIATLIILSIIATVSWLSNREIEKSLVRARKSEAELKQERDNLEITVEKRTRELKETQAERMAELYRFAEFGRLSSGLFHDLMNPLNAISLNIEQLRNKSDAAPIQDSAGYVDRAITSAKKLQDLVTAVRKQLVRQEPTKTAFSLNDEVKYVIDVLSHKAMKANVAIRFSPENDIQISGDPVKFNQIVLNLVANAIDAYPSKEKGSGREVFISLTDLPDKVMLEVEDNGSGISKENIAKIFEPFFTTKAENQGMGIGLSMTKRIVEKDFSGTIGVISREGEGATFTVTLKK